MAIGVGLSDSNIETRAKTTCLWPYFTSIHVQLLLSSDLFTPMAELLPHSDSIPLWRQHAPLATRMPHSNGSPAVTKGDTY